MRIKLNQADVLKIDADLVEAYLGMKARRDLAWTEEQLAADLVEVGVEISEERMAEVFVELKRRGTAVDAAPEDPGPVELFASRPE